MDFRLFGYDVLIYMNSVTRGKTWVDVYKDKGDPEGPLTVFVGSVRVELYPPSPAHKE